MNFKKIVTYYLVIEIIALLIAYILLMKKSNHFANYIGMVTAISCAVGFGLAFYFIFLLLKKKLTINKFTIYFLLSLLGVVLPYVLMFWIMSQLH